MEKSQFTQEDIIQVGRRVYAKAPVSKNLEQTPPSSGESSGQSQINERDIGSLFHKVVNVLAGARFRNPWTVWEELKFTNRWTESYESDDDIIDLVDGSIAEALYLLGAIEEKHPGIVLVPELPFMASAADKNEAFDIVMEDPKRLRQALQEGKKSITPLTAGILESDDPEEKKKILASVRYAIPDIVGFVAKTDEARLVQRQLMKAIYADNSGTKRYMLAPELLEEQQKLLREVMRCMLQKELEIHVIELKTNSWSDIQTTQKSDEAIIFEHRRDIAHTLLAMRKVFEAVNPEAFKGDQFDVTADGLSETIKVHIGTVDCPTLYAYDGEVKHKAPGQVSSRLVEVPVQTVRNACRERVVLDQKRIEKQIAAEKTKQQLQKVREELAA